jgi:hypothetical protein
MPHKGTPIRYGQNQPVRNRQQGAGKICEHPLCGLPAYPISQRRICVDMQARNFSRNTA